MKPNPVNDAQDKFGPGALHDAFLSAATGLMRGATVLAAAPSSEFAWAFALVSGQILECSLKASPAKKTKLAEEELKKNSATNSRSFGQKPPSLASPSALCGNGRNFKQLARNPFHLRYPTKVNALVLPDVQQTETALRNLVDTVRNAVVADG